MNPLNLPDSEWRKVLTPAELGILREKGTESPFRGEYPFDKREGTYLCAGCKAAGQETPLFQSKTKYDSKTGWPIFITATLKLLEVDGNLTEGLKFTVTIATAI